MAIKKPIVFYDDSQRWEEVRANDSLYGAEGVSLQTVEIDFGLTPTSSKKFTITAIGVTTENKIKVSTNPIPATDRVGNDWEVEMPFFSAVADTDQFFLNVVFPHWVVGKRNIDYQII